MSSINRQLGSIMLLIGLEIGAGMMALPIVIAYIGFPLGCTVILFSCVLMTITSLQCAECSLAFPTVTSFASIAKNLLGVFGQGVVWAASLFSLFMLLTAYISAAGSAMHSTFGFNQNTMYCLFTLVLGGFIVIGTVAVDWLNRALLFIKIALLLLTCFVLSLHIHVKFLLLSFPVFKYILATLPILISAFVGHFIIPTIKIYLNSDAKALFRVIIFSNVFVFIIYILWISSIIGAIPYNGDHGFEFIFNRSSSANVGDVMYLIGHNVSTHVNIILELFMCFAVTTSFLTVGLSLYHFLIEIIKVDHMSIHYKKIISAIIAFMIPLFIVYMTPDIFLALINYVGLCCNILLIIMPFFMIRNLHRQQYSFHYKLVANNYIRYIIVIYGVLMVGYQYYALLT